MSNQELNYSEQFAFEHADQHIGCVRCKESHHISNICQSCYRCFFKEKYVTDKNGYHSPVVFCSCGKKYLWD
jgi:hypothetical protein